MKVGIVFDNRQRPETTGYYCHRALGPLVDLEHLLPVELEFIDPSIFDLFLFIDDGLDYVIPQRCRPRAAWTIDTHMDMARCVQRFGDADFLLASQKNGATALRESLGRTVDWLPLACDPEIHRHMSGERKCHDVGFVGNVVIGHERHRLLGQLIERYPSSWFGQALFDEMSRMYSRSHVGFNCSIADDLNMRLFEIPSCGIPLITNHIEGNGLDELFEQGRHLLTFRSDDELYCHVDRLLHDRALAETLATQGKHHVQQNHTYDHRMVQLLKIVTQTRVTISVGGKAADYFEFDRPDVRTLIPASAYRILDIGCASGRLGMALKSERGCHVTEIEANSTAAGTAAKRLDQVTESSIEAVPEGAFPPASFDCIVLADVLEHLRNPLEVLCKCRYWLIYSGSLVISVPNSRHHSIISGLIDGNWTYERAGLLDEDHVRCFTRRELEKLLYRAGFAISVRSAVPGSGYEEWRQSGELGTVRIGSLCVSGLDPVDAEEFFIYQHLVRSQPRVRRDYGLTSIVIVTFNQLWCTRQCVDSILTRTDEKIELIFVDNGSTDGTPEYLQSIPGARVILNAENRGFASAVNQGLQIAGGQQLLLLNNDCIVTTGWLEGLLESLHDDSSNGLVGPVSNNVSGEQQIPVKYTDLSSLDGFAWDCRSHRQLTVTDRLVGFCLLFRREVMDRVGLLDERFEIGCFEDDDFCRRARNAGYRALIASHVFVHHFGSATFRGSGVNFAEILRTNEQRYQEKWEPPSPRRQSGLRGTAEHSPTTSLSDRYSVLRMFDNTHLLQRKHIRLSLCMIVRDNEDTIEACLASIYPWVDEIIIVDTGSKDRTIEICRKFGARIFEFPWCDDFSAARNESLKHARGEWIFWMDSDDVIDQEQGRKLRELAYGEHPVDCLGYLAQVHCESAEPGQMTVVDQVKLFRNRPDMRFEHRIHEQILPSIRRANGSVAFTNLFVIHKGSIQTPEVRRRKLERDFRILAKDLEDRPNHPFVLFNLGMTYEDAAEYGEAERYLRMCLAASTDGESHLPKAYSLLINTLNRQGRTQDAYDEASNALRRYPGDKELLFRRSLLALDLNRLPEAADDMQRVLNEVVDRTFQSLDPGITSHKAFHNLALIYEQQGKSSEAMECWEKAISVCPEFSPSWQAIGQLHVRNGDSTSLESLLFRLRRLPKQQVTAALVEAWYHKQLRNPEAAQEVLRSAFLSTGSIECLDELARILMETGQFEECYDVLLQMQSLGPPDAAVLHNLATVLEATHREQEAIPYLQKSLELRPDGLSSSFQLSSLLCKHGRMREALDVLTAAARFHVNNIPLQEVIRLLQQELNGNGTMGDSTGRFTQ